jgi:hypothetical protein
VSHAVSSLDAGVVIDRVRVRVQPRDGGAARVGERERERVQARAGDHRIVVSELCIDTEAALEDLEARRFGERVAGALSERLVALQARRVDAILAGRSRGGRIQVRALRVVLRGAEAERPDLRAIVLALAGAVERSVTS